MRALAVVLALAGLLLATESAQACSCAFARPDVQLERSDAAAVVRLVDIRNAGSTTAELVYRVGRVVKDGPGLRRGRRIAIRDDLAGSCGLIRRVGRLTGLFLRRLGDRWTANACTEISARQMRRLAKEDAAAAAPALRFGVASLKPACRPSAATTGA